MTHGFYIFFYAKKSFKWEAPKNWYTEMIDDFKEFWKEKNDLSCL